MLRAAVGGFFIGHGTQKLFGWFEGPGLKAQSEGFEKMGLKPGKVHAVAAGAAETLGGAGLALGYRTPLASAGIVSVMLTAINRVHLKNGPWAAKGGYEYNAVLIAAAVTLAESGPGPLSLDALRGKEKSGAKWGLFSLLLGAAGAAGAHVLAESRTTPEVTPPAAAPQASMNGADPLAAPAAQVDTAAEDAPADTAAPTDTEQEPAAVREASDGADAPPADEAEHTSEDAGPSEA